MPSRSRRRAQLSAACLARVDGHRGAGLGSLDLDRPSLPPSGDPVSTPEATMARVATDKPSMTPASMPLATTSLPSTVPAALPLLAMETASPAPAPSSGPPGRAVQRRFHRARGASIDQPATMSDSNAVPEAAAIARRPAVATPQGAPRPAGDRHRATRAKVQSASAATRPPGAPGGRCDASGLLGRAWCALNPCKAAARGRANPECMERLRAEASRQQRVERQ